MCVFRDLWSSVVVMQRKKKKKKKDKRSSKQENRVCGEVNGSKGNWERR